MLAVSTCLFCVVNLLVVKLSFLQIGCLWIRLLWLVRWWNPKVNLSLSLSLSVRTQTFFFFVCWHLTKEFVLILFTGEKSTSISLQALRQSFEIPLTGKAHRAMADVDLLSIILPRLTFVLKWSISDLIMKSFLPSDSPKSKKKSLR